MLSSSCHSLTLENFAPPKPVPPHWSSLCPHFKNVEVERHAHGIKIPETMQLVFYASVLQEVIRFGIVSPLVAQDLDEALERFRWESFEIWLDINGDRLVRCYRRQASTTAPVGS